MNSQSKTINWDNYRSLFPVLKNWTYFITAGAGAIPKPVFDSITDAYKRVLKDGGYAFQKNLALVEQCRLNIAQLINANVDDIAFIPHVSFGMNVLAHAYQKSRLVITPEEEFQASKLPWQRINYNMHYVPSSKDLQQNLIHTIQQIRKAVVVCSAVQYATGYKIPLNQIVNKKHSEINCIINSTQAIGAFNIDVKETPIDAMVCSCYKWLFCGEGISFLYISPNFFKQLKPTIVGWRSVKSSMAFKNHTDYYPSARIFEIGWSNMTIFSGLKKSLDILYEIGIDNISQRIQYLMNYLIDKLIQYNIPIISTISPEHQSGIILIGPFNDTNRIVNKLFQNKILVTERMGGIRLSLHFYNCEDDINHFIDVISNNI